MTGPAAVPCGLDEVGQGRDAVAMLGGHPQIHSLLAVVPWAVFRKTKKAGGEMKNYKCGTSSSGNIFMEVGLRPINSGQRHYMQG